MDDTIYVILLITLVGYSESLECYICSNVADVNKCNVTRSCAAGQSCYHNLIAGQKSLGCVDNKNCDSHAAVSTIVGRDLVSRETSSCFECCSTDRCNSALCLRLEPKACADDESVDCARLNSLFSICSDVAHARSVCAKFCGLCVVDGNWTLWSTWSKCDVTCENGHQTRTRTCTNPAPKNGGLNCVGDGIMTKDCKKEQPCPVHGGWSDWSNWGTCSVTCGMGLQRRTRTCSNPPPSLAGNHCFGVNIESQLCMPAPCANGGWSDWTSWSSCSATCGGGIRTQTRSCSNPSPSPYGQSCVGSNDRVESCANNNCATNHCSTSPCVHGQCYDVSNDFLCYCDHGYEGRYCNISYYYCNSNPCVHGSCVSGFSGYKCTCFEGYFGINCDVSRLENIYEMVSRGKTELRLDLTAADGTSVYETFQNFRLDERPYYTLHIDQGVGTAGDVNGLSYHNGNFFSTFDMDRDVSSGNCAVDRHGGWWYNYCAYANLNGEYVTPGTQRPVRPEVGMIYYSFKRWESLKVSKMMFRRI